MSGAVVVPFRRPGQAQEPAIPPHIKAELARLKAKWAAERADEVRERRTLAVQLREFDQLHARALERMAQERAAGLHGYGEWTPAWTEGSPLRDPCPDCPEEHTG